MRRAINKKSERMNDPLLMAFLRFLNIFRIFSSYNEYITYYISNVSYYRMTGEICMVFFMSYYIYSNFMIDRLSLKGLAQKSS